MKKCIDPAFQDQIMATVENGIKYYIYKYATRHERRFFPRVGLIGNQTRKHVHWGGLLYIYVLRIYEFSIPGPKIPYSRF